MIVVVGILFAVAVLFGLVALVGAPYVPSLRSEVRSALRVLYPLTQQDVVVDLGSGDGTVLLEAIRCGARGVGVELNPILVMFSRFRLRGRALIHFGDMWRMQLPKEVSLVYVFSVSRDTKRLEGFMQQQANRLQKEIFLMTFGATLPRHIPVRTLKAHTLYSFKPLQAD